jgi:hypothetical protein
MNTTQAVIIIPHLVLPYINSLFGDAVATDLMSSHRLLFRFVPSKEECEKEPDDTEHNQTLTMGWSLFPFH